MLGKDFEDFLLTLQTLSFNINLEHSNSSLWSVVFYIHVNCMNSHFLRLIFLKNIELLIIFHQIRLIFLKSMC